MATATIGIGNSDDKLPQRKWAEFQSRMHEEIKVRKYTAHFEGMSLPTAPWQNACWVIEVEEEQLVDLARFLAQMAERYQQNNIAFTVGKTILISPGDK